MKIGTIVKVVDNSFEAPECTVGAYGVVMPKEVWWGTRGTDITGNAAVLFCYYKEVSPDLYYEPWIFAEEDLQPVLGSEDLPGGLFDRMNRSYKTFKQESEDLDENLFQGAPEELSFPSWEGVEAEVVEVSVEDQLNSLISEYKQQVECYLREYLNLAEESSDKTADMRKKSEAVVDEIKELRRSLQCKLER